MLGLMYFDANALAQQVPKINISISFSAGKLSTALVHLEKESKINIVFEGSMLSTFRITQQQFNNKPLRQVLEFLLKETDLTYEFVDHYIVIKKKQERKDANDQSYKAKQNEVTLSGYVEDNSSGEKLAAATLYIYDVAKGCFTNNFGYYSIGLPIQTQRIRITYLGYKTIDTTLRIIADMRINFKLEPESSDLDMVEIVADRIVGIQESAQMSKLTLSPSLIASVPKFLGESDVMKTLQLLPGVQQGSEGTAALLVRGGSADQNLILMDGAVLYNPSHLLGIFSTFNTTTIKHVDLYKGAFPARFGGRLSSITEIITKDGNLKSIHGEFSIGILASQLTLEGPIVKDKTSVVISGRRTYGDLILSPIIKANTDNIDKFALYFYDLNFKLQHIFSENDRIILSLYGGKDQLRIKNKTSDNQQEYIFDMGLGWGNYNGSLRWNHVFSKNLFSNFTAIVSDYNFGVNFGYETKDQNLERITKSNFNSGIRDYGLKADFDYRPLSSHNVKLGLAYTHHIFTPGVSLSVELENGTKASNVESDNEQIKGGELDAYVEHDWKVSPKLSINSGIHWSGFATEEKFYHYLQPRISARYLLPANWGLKASYARMAQYLHLLAGNTISLPTDLWVPVTKSVKPQTAHQIALGIARNVLHNKIEFSLEAYYKHMENVIEYKDGEEYASSVNKLWSDKVLAGTGKAYGLELMLQKKEGKFTGWIAYTLSKTMRHVPGINFDRSFAYKYDRLHDFKVVMIYKLTKNIEVSGCWVYQSASPFTIPIGQYEGVEDYGPDANSSLAIPNITSRNNMRLEAYHRLDVGINFIRQKKNGVIRTWNFSVFNAYNRRNPFFYYNNFNAQGQSASITGISLLPLLPSISYNLKF
jgi:hypothetical protein